MKWLTNLRYLKYAPRRWAMDYLLGIEAKTLESSEALLSTATEIRDRGIVFRVSAERLVD